MKKILKNKGRIFAATLCLIFGCQNVSEKPVEKDGKVYGVTKGAFLDRWWDYYERGLSFTDGGFWQEAERDFREALKMRDTDHFRTRTYGRHLLDYFPHRELGISLYHQKSYSESIRELEVSLSSEKSAKAEYYLDKARKSWIEQNHLDKNPPEISVDSPSDMLISNGFTVMVSGLAKDDTYVREVLINDSPVRIDLSSPQVPFRKEVPIMSGENTITIDVKDLTGRAVRMTKKVRCDRSGPVVSIEEPEQSDGKNYLIRGYALDDTGIREIRINNRIIPADAAREFSLNYPLELSAGQEKIIVVAEDIVGNQTRAEIAKPSYRSSDIPKLFASLVSDRGIVRTEKQIEKYRNIGNYYALIIGINQYKKWKPLETAVNDALALNDILIRRYGFKKENVRLRTDRDATWKNLTDDMKELADKLTENDNLLVYFAGHGQLDTDNITKDGGYWIPVEGSQEDKSTWITNSVIRDILGTGNQGKNILVIADSCYSGSLLKDNQPAANDRKQTMPDSRGKKGIDSEVFPSKSGFYQKIIELSGKKSRQVLSSGGIEPVSDKGKGNHSRFAHHFLTVLRENRHLAIDITYLYNSGLWKSVVDEGGQRPEIGRFKTDKDDGGQFIFVLNDGSAIPLKSDSDTDIVMNLIRQFRQQYERFIPSLIADYRKSNIEPPEIRIRGWDDTVFAEEAFLQIEAKDTGHGIQSLSVNDLKVIGRPGRDKLYCNYVAQLKEGDNLFRIECSDQIGNIRRKEIRIHRKLRKVNETGSRMSVALYRFGTDGNRAETLEETFLSEVVGSGRFKVIEGKHRGAAKDVSEDENDAAEFARKAKAEFAMIGKGIMKKDSLEIRVRMIDAADSEIISTQDVYGEDTDTGTLCKGLIVKLKDEFPIVEGEILKMKDQEVIISLSEESRIKKGMRVIFFEEGDVVSDSKTGAILGSDSHELGIGTIRRVLPKMSYAVLSDANILGKLNPTHKVITK